MAKIALFLVFSFAIVLSIQSVVGDDALSPEQINAVTSEFKDAAQSLSSAAGSASDSMKETASSWTGWAKDKLSSYGLISPTGSESPAPAPENAPASSPENAPASSPENAPASSPAYSRSFGPAPTAAPTPAPSPMV